MCFPCNVLGLQKSLSFSRLASWSLSWDERFRRLQLQLSEALDCSGYLLRKLRRFSHWKLRASFHIHGSQPCRDKTHFLGRRFFVQHHRLAEERSSDWHVRRTAVSAQLHPRKKRQLRARKLNGRERLSFRQSQKRDLRQRRSKKPGMCPASLSCLASAFTFSRQAFFSAWPAALKMSSGLKLAEFPAASALG